MTMPVLNEYALGGVFKQLADAAGDGIEFWQGQPGGAIEQLRQLADPSLVLDQNYPGGVYKQIYDAISLGGEYVGPLDLISGAALVAYGPRALSAVMRGQPLWTLREDSGNTTQTFNSDGTTGEAPISAITSFLNGANGFVSVWKDQSGNAKHGLQATTARQPGWLASGGPNSKPALTFDYDVRQWLAPADVVTLTGGAATVFAVVRVDMDLDAGDSAFLGEFTGLNANDGIDANGPDWDFRIVSTATEPFGAQAIADADEFSALYNYNAANAGVSSGTFVLFDGISGPSDGQLVINGTPLTLDGSEGGVVGDISFRLGIGTSDVGSVEAGGSYPILNGRLSELIIYPGIKSSGDRLAVRQNIADYYGITLP